MTANKHGGEQKTSHNRSAKAHVPAPPQDREVKGVSRRAPGRDVGQFTGLGRPAQQKK